MVITVAMWFLSTSFGGLRAGLPVRRMGVTMRASTNTMAAVAQTLSEQRDPIHTEWSDWIAKTSSNRRLTFGAKRSSDRSVCSLNFSRS